MSIIPCHLETEYASSVIKVRCIGILVFILALLILHGFLDKQEVTARVFMPLLECPSKRCGINKSLGNLILQLRASKFLKFQEVLYFCALFFFYFLLLTLMLDFISCT